MSLRSLRLRNPSSIPINEAFAGEKGLLSLQIVPARPRFNGLPQGFLR
ncbi:MAG: hypothetical protein H6632_09435 [Anaerolineales bacterium]|nr:hypothetical protein [Anaerolineales bacterium]